MRSTASHWERVSRHSSARYTLAVTTTALALLLRHLLNPFLGNSAPFATLYAAFAFLSIYAGPGPCILAVVLGWIGATHWFGAPGGSFALWYTAAHIVGSVVYLLVSALIAVAGQMARRSKTKLAIALDTLKHRDEELSVEREHLEARVQRRTAELERAQTKFRQLLEMAPDALVGVNGSGQIIFLNAQAERLFGYSGEQLLGKPIEVLMPERFHGNHADYRAHFFTQPRTRAMGAGLELYGLRKDGREIPVEISLSPLETEDGMVVTSAIRDISERKKSEEALRALTGQLLRLQDNERRRIARELHDSAGQTLAALSMTLQPLQGQNRLDAATARAINESLEMISGLSRELRTISHLLHPPLLDEVGLASALHSFLDGFKDRSGIDVTLKIPDDFERLPNDLEIAIFRIVQEALTNVHRHSGSPAAEVRITQCDTEVRVEIADQGKGIPPEKQEAMNSGVKLGVGTRGMVERVKQLGGRLDITSSSQGTVVVVRLPVVSGSSITAV